MKKLFPNRKERNGNMDNLPDIFGEKLRPKKKHPLVVRVTTSSWIDKRGIHQKRSIIPLQRKSNGAFDILNEDANCVGADVTFERITNLDKCRDGVYYVDICNQKMDWETGYIDDYDFILLPYEKNKPTN